MALTAAMAASAAAPTRVITSAFSAASLTGCVTDQGNVVLQSTATLTIELGGPVPCSGYDQLNVALSLTLNQPKLIVALTNGFAPTAGQGFKILSWGALSGTFANITLPALSPGLAWNTTALYTAGTIAVSGGAAAAASDAPIPGWALVVLAMGLGLIASSQLRRHPV
jgi:hypothetical protein